MLLSRVGKKSKLTAHQTKTSKLTLSCSSVNIFVQEIKEKLTLESLNQRQTRRARSSSPRSTPLSLLLSSNERPISVTCQGSDCKFWTTFRSRAHGLETERTYSLRTHFGALRGRDGEEEEPLASVVFPSPTIAKQCTKRHAAAHASHWSL